MVFENGVFIRCLHFCLGGMQWQGTHVLPVCGRYFYPYSLDILIVYNDAETIGKVSFRVESFWVSEMYV